MPTAAAVYCIHVVPYSLKGRQPHPLYVQCRPVQSHVIPPSKVKQKRPPSLVMRLPSKPHGQRNQYCQPHLSLSMPHRASWKGLASYRTVRGRGSWKRKKQGSYYLPAFYRKDHEIFLGGYSSTSKTPWINNHFTNFTGKLSYEKSASQQKVASTKYFNSISLFLSGSPL